MKAVKNNRFYSGSANSGLRPLQKFAFYCCNNRLQLQNGRVALALEKVREQKEAPFLEPYMLYL